MGVASGHRRTTTSSCAGKPVDPALTSYTAVADRIKGLGNVDGYDDDKLVGIKMVWRREMMAADVELQWDERQFFGWEKERLGGGARKNAVQNST